MITIDNAVAADERGIIVEYLHDIIGRYPHGTATDDETDEIVRSELADELAVLLVGHDESGATVGCVGLRRVDESWAELTKVYVTPDARGSGLGRRLVEAMEGEARRIGFSFIRLDTRADLVEARRLYERLGYSEVDAFNDNSYAEHWFAKDLY